MKKQNLLFFVICSFILLMPFVLSAPPQAEVISSSNGYQIETPEFTVLKMGNDFDFHFHIYNYTNGVPLNRSDIVCIFHLYNSTGNHIFVDNNVTKITNGWDYEVEISKTNFSYEGRYSYLMACYSTLTNTGGFISVPFAVTKDGQLWDYSGFSGITFLLFIVLIFITIATISIIAIYRDNYGVVLPSMLIIVFNAIIGLRVSSMLFNSVSVIDTVTKTDIVFILDTLYLIWIWIFWLLLTFIVIYLGYKVIMLFYSLAGGRSTREEEED